MMNNNIVNPEELFEQLKTSAQSEAQRNNLERVHQVCKSQHDSGKKDFTLATIAKMCGDEGPALQTLYNKTGLYYKGLINAWATYTGGSTVKVRKEKIITTSEQVAIDKIEDIGLRAWVASLIADNANLKRSNILLRKASGIKIDMRKSIPQSAEVVTKQSPVYDLINLTDTEINALKHSISNKQFAEFNLYKDENGRVISKDTENELQKIGYVDAIEKILDIMDRVNDSKKS